ACLHYTVIRQLDALGFKRYLEEEQIQKAYSLQKLWTENLIKYHIRYQLPETTLPEFIHDDINKRFDVLNGISEHVCKQWLGEDLQVQDFANMLKCLFVSLQLQYGTITNEFCDEVSKFCYPIKQTSHAAQDGRQNGSTEESLPIGFERNIKDDKVVA